jgi:hypothetical protein
MKHKKAKHHSVNEHGYSEREGKAWGHGQHANMPHETVMSSYPKNKGAHSKDLNDTITNIDREIMQEEGQVHKHVSNQH